MIRTQIKNDRLGMHVLWDCKPRRHHLPCTLAGDRPPLSLPISSSTPLTSKQRPLLFTLTSELALLLVARGESETLTVLLRAGPDLTLYIEDAGIFVINGRKLPGMVRLISCNQNQEWTASRVFLNSRIVESHFNCVRSGFESPSISIASITAV